MTQSRDVLSIELVASIAEFGASAPWSGWVQIVGSMERGWFTHEDGKRDQCSMKRLTRLGPSRIVSHGPFSKWPERVTVSHHCRAASVSSPATRHAKRHPPTPKCQSDFGEQSTTAFDGSRSRKSAFNHLATTHAQTTLSHWQACRHSSFLQFTSTYAATQSTLNLRRIYILNALSTLAHKYSGDAPPNLRQCR
jgi:hypothetical protein